MMTIETKNVNVSSGAHPGPIILSDYAYPIVGKVHNITLTIKDIRTCILEKAIVEEIIGENQTLRLDLFNYNTDNSIKTTTTHTTNTVQADTAKKTTVTIDTVKTTATADTTTAKTDKTTASSTTATDSTATKTASTIDTTTPSTGATTVSASATDKK